MATWTSRCGFSEKAAEKNFGGQEKGPNGPNGPNGRNGKRVVAVLGIIGGMGSMRSTCFPEVGF